jgi:rhodanese-related sulfurtransferase
LSGSELFLYALMVVVAVPIIRRVIWFFKVRHYNPDEVAEKLSSGEALVLLDVRTTSERQRGGLRDSLHIPLHDLGRRMHELEPHRNKEIVVYCQTGSRSLSAAARIAKAGFKAVNLKGGIAEWNFQNR